MPALLSFLEMEQTTFLRYIFNFDLRFELVLARTIPGGIPGFEMPSAFSSVMTSVFGILAALKKVQNYHYKKDVNDLMNFL